MNASGSLSSVSTSALGPPPIEPMDILPRERAAEARLFVVSNSKLWRRGPSGATGQHDWQAAGAALAAGTLVSHRGSLYLAAHFALFRRDRVGLAGDHGWVEVGTLPASPVAMASHRGELLAVFENRLWRRGAPFAGGSERWLAVGDACGVTALTSHQGRLLAVAEGTLWAREQVDPDGDEGWLDVGALTACYPPADVFAMASHGGVLHAVFNDKLHRRTSAESRAAGAWVAPLWDPLGNAFSVTGMASHPAVCE